MTSAETHIYECPSKPNRGLVVVHAGIPNGFGGVIPGAIWCWSHSTWESIPDGWFDREAMLREEILTEWPHIKSCDRYGFQSQPLTGWITRYCGHRGWRKPDADNLHDVHRFMRNLEEGKPLR